LAYSIEELDIASEVSASFGQLLGAVTPAIVTGGIPFVGTALQRFTASAIDGATNCFLALRTGIITRNAYGYILTAKEERPSRADIFKDAGSMLSSICLEPIGDLIKAVQTDTVGIGTDIILKAREGIEKLKANSEAVTAKAVEAGAEITFRAQEGIGKLQEYSKIVTAKAMDAGSEITSKAQAGIDKLKESTSKLQDGIDKTQEGIEKLKETSKTVTSRAVEFGVDFTTNVKEAVLGRLKKNE
jgi:X-X-X-Leu-X-X-Gly heptad repeat protein